LQLEVTWPVPKQVQQFRDAPVDRAFHIRQGSDVLSPLVLKTNAKLLFVGTGATRLPPSH
jgi:hypothetical protein